MDQVYRIEIPIEAINETDASALRSLETALQRIFSSATKSKSAAQDAMNAINSGASGAASSMNKLDGALDKTAQGFENAADSAEDVGTAGEQAADEAGAAAEKLGDDVEDVAGSYKETGRAAKEAGQGASSAFNQAGQQVDRFTQRTEKSQQSLRKMFAQKLQLTLAAIDKISPVLKSVGSSLKNLTAKAWHVAVKMTDLVTAPFRKLVQMITSPIAMTLSLAGVGLGASSFLTTFTDFSAGMSNVKALSRATDEEFERLTETAENLGATTKFTAAEASQGMQYLAMAGWDTNQIIEAMPGLLDLAAAGATDLGTAADIVSDVMTAMGMSADQASTAADIFARTATMTNTTISMMGESLKYAAPIAHSFGLSLSEVSTMVGMMGNAGIKASQAGTAIRSSLLKMASPSKEAADLMKQLGLSFSNADGSMKNMGQIIGNLQEAFAGLTAEQRLNYAETLFGTMASSAWLGMIDQGADEYNRLYNAIDNSAGAAKEMSEIQLDNLQGDMTRLQSAVDGMKISLMKQLDPYLRKGVQWLTGKIPMLTEKVGDFVTKGIEKATELKNFLKGVFTSSEFQNADGIAEKFFLAWDKIIAEPFSEWWDGNGQNMVLGVVEKVGSGMGQMYHGIISGIFAALKGEEIDFEGLNLTGLAKAGAQAAKTFITSFKDAFDLGDLWSSAPGLLKAGLFGFGALKLGGGALGLVRTIGQIKTAFAGVKVAAGTASTATAAFGTSAAAGVAGTTKLAAGLGMVKTALAVIPVWGWVAAAALTAVTVGYIAWSNAQKEHERELLNTGKAAAQMAQDYSNSVDRISQATDAVETIKSIQLQIEEDKGGNQQVIDNFNTELQEIQNRTVWLTAKIAQNSLTPEEAAEYQKQLEVVKGQIAEVEAKLRDGTLTPEEVAEYQRQLEVLKGQKAELEAALADGTLTKSDIERYQSELDALKGKTVDVIASLNDEGYDSAQVAIISEQVAAIQEGEKSVTLTIANNTQLTPEQIEAYVTQLSDLMTKKTEYELKIEGAGLTPEQIGQYKTELDKIQSKLAVVTTKINKGQGTMSDAEWQSLISEAATLQAQAADIKIVLSGSEMNDQEVANTKKLLGEVRGEATGILLNIGYSPDSDISQDELNSIISDLSNIGTIKAELDIGLKEGSMGVKELEELNNKLNESYANLIEASGGYFTQEDVERGRITQDRYDSWVQRETVRAEADRLNFQAQVKEDRGNIPELVQRRDEAQAVVDYHTAMAEGSLSDYDFLSGLEAKRQLLLAEYRNSDQGDEATERLMQGGSDLIQQARDRQWSELFGSAPANFDSMQPDQIFGQYTGGLLGFGTHWEADYNKNPFESALKELEDRVNMQDTNTDEVSAKAAAAQAALMQQYGNEVRAVEMNSFAGFGVTDKNSKATIDQLAQSYTQLDTAGQEMFANAIAGLVELNSTVDYISEAEKVDIGAILGQAEQSVTISANIEVMGDLESKLTEISKAYQTAASDAAKADFNAANIDAVNAALESLGLDKIENLSELQSKLDAIAAVDPSGLNFDAAAASLEKLGGDASSTQEKVAAAKAQLDALAGTYNVTIKYNVVGSIPDAPKTNAMGGIYDGAFLSWVAEDGPEAIIPLGNDKRGRGLDLWMQAGQMLGVNEFADGGIMAPYTGAIADLPDFVLDDEDAPAPVAVPTGNNSGHGQQTIEVSIDSSPTFEIKGGSPDDIMAALKSHMKELAELLGTEFAEQISDIVLNIA